MNYCRALEVARRRLAKTRAVCALQFRSGGRRFTLDQGGLPCPLYLYPKVGLVAAQPGWLLARFVAGWGRRGT
jgi:hypothetical protein